MWLVDRLVNLMSGLGTTRDKVTATGYAFQPLDRMQLEAAYRGDWIARKIVDVPAFDETREWRDWQAEKPQIEAIEKEEARLGVQGKVTKARKLARLYGGAALLMGVRGNNPAEPLDVERVTKGGLQYLHALSRDEITAGEIETDPVSPLFGEPKEYTLSSRAGAQVTIHPSRVIRFIGAEVPNAIQAAEPWGDSVLQAVNDAVQHAGLAAGGIASLLQEAKVDIIRVPGFMESLGSQEYRDKIIERFSLANIGKSTVNAVLLDLEEEWSQKQISFAQLPEVLNTYLQIASGAADIPATRLLGQTPGGLQSTGQSDIRNYYDRISAGQNLDLRPALAPRLDEVLIRSALGTRPPDVHYTWAPLWQESGTERADIALKKAQAVKAIADTGLIPDRAFARGVQNMFVEDGTFPGLDAALEEFGDEPEEPEDKTDPAGQITADAKPRTLYVSRPLLNTTEFLAWARGQGFADTLEAGDLHVTIAYSRQALDWMKVGDTWSGDRDGTMTVQPGGARLVEALGDKGAVVLLFNSSELAWRHMAIREAGASWDYPEYQPHVTITYRGAGVDLSKVEPYRGRLEFGPEVFAEVDEGWADRGGSQQGDRPFGDAFDPNQPRDPRGRWVAAGARIEAVGLRAGENVAIHVAFASVSRPAELSKVLGVDVRGFKHSISNQAIKHMRDRHPNLTLDDFKLLPQIVSRAKPQLSAERGVNGVPRVLYKAAIGGVTYEYVAEYRRRKQRLDAITLYRK